MLLNVQFLTGQKGMVTGINETDTVGDLKEKIAALANGPSVEEQQLLFGGRLLQDDSETLADLDIFGETCIMCVTRPTKNSNPSRHTNGTKTPESKPKPKPKALDVDAAAAADAAVSASATEASASAAAAEPAETAAASEGGAAKTGATGEAEEVVPSKEAGGEDEVKEEMIPLSLKTLRGTHTLLEVPAHATFGHIKHQYIQPIEKFPAIQMRLIYMGQLTDDSKTPFDYNICDESFIHLVRRPNESIKSEVITQNSLRANCMWCHRAGVQLKLRPQCRTCKNEGAMYKDRVIEIGKSKWSDLEDLKGICFRCGNAGKEVDLSMGFLCTGQEGEKDGPICPGRNPQDRKMLHVYDGGDLVESLNQIFGYAHARGFEV